MKELQWSPDAIEDLDNIFDTIAEDDVNAAYHVIEEIRVKASDLLIAPKSGIMIPELGKEEFREIHHRMYTIVYEITDNSIVVHEIFHQRRIHIRSYHKM